jgi:predicted MFS family arabinose efflux permease
MRLPPQTAERSAQSRTLGQIGEGLRYIVSDRRVLLVLLLVSFISVFAIPAYTTLMPVVADQILHVGVTGLGTLTSFLALGSVTAAVGLAYTSTPEQRRFFMIGGAATGSTLLLLFSFSRNFALSLALLVGVGFCMVANNATGNTIIQSYVPDRLRGRLMSVWSLVLVGLAPFGSFFTGSLANWTSAPFAIGVGALICLVAALIIVPQMLGWHWPRRKAPPQTSDILLIEHEGVQHGD